MTQLELFTTPKRKPNKQHQDILNHLQTGKGLTFLEAALKIGVGAISQRAGELIRMGYPIKKRWIQLQNGKKVKEYYL